MKSYNKFKPIIEANCQTIHEMVRLKGLHIDTLSFLHRHFLSQLVDMDNSEIQCSSGCGYCCHLKVTASIPEVLVILNFLQKDEQIDRYREQIENSQDLFSSRTNKNLNWWLENRVPCLFFDQEKQLCRIYEVRPFTCRGYHSLDARQCEKGYSQKRIIPIPCYPDLKRSCEAYSISFDRAMSQLGRQSAQRELSSTVALLIQNQNLITRWFDGEQIIPA